MASQTVIVEQSGAVTTLTLNRPDKLNAFNEEMCQALQVALTGIASDGVTRAVLLTGAGRGFSAGQDLAAIDYAQGDPRLGDLLDRCYSPIVRQLRDLAVPVICAVNGVAAGVGANIALGCDIVLAARSAKFLQPFAKLGLVPDGGGTYHLPRLVGEVRAKGLAMLAQPLSAEKAESWGLIWRVVDDEALMGEARALAEELATQPTIGLGMIKKVLHASASNDLDSQLDLERDTQAVAGRTPDHLEGVQAFLEKRAPVFTGRSDS